MKLKLKYPLGKGKYYFQIRSGLKDILIHRKEKEVAVRKLLEYRKNGKIGQWLGKWNGKKFEEESIPELSIN